MAISVIATSYGNSGTTSPAIDSTSANLLLVPMYLCAASFTATSDSKSNPYTNLSRFDATSAGYSNYQTYCAEADIVAVGGSHTATNALGYARVGLIAVAGADATPYDNESGLGGTGTGTSFQPGSITPSVDGCLLVSTFVAVGGGTITPPAGWTVIVNETNTAALAYLIQGTAAAVNPTWGTSSTVNASCTMTVWKPAAGGGGSTQPPRSMYLNRLRRAA